VLPVLENPSEGPVSRAPHKLTPGHISLVQGHSKETIPSG
jgi:hypothetical protein